jgi:4-amino-4-deoxy-L-arabinose transferase-like glycosyltransferase
MSRSLVAGLLFAFLFAVDAKLLFVYAMIMSEPLFIVFTLGTLLTLAVYFDSRRWPWLLVAGALSALAYLTRYSGLALLATVALVLFIVEPSWKKKVGSLIIYLAGALPFVLAWALRNALLGLSMTNRVFRYHPLPATKVEAGVHQVLEWLIPTSLPDSISTLRVLSILKATVTEGTAPYLVIGLIGAALLAWLIIVSVQLWSRGDQDSVRVPFFSSMAYLFVYLLAIVLSMMFFDASTPFTDRILAPVYIGLLVGFVMLAVTVWRTQSGPLRALVIICLIGASVLSLVNTRQAMAHLRKNPLGFAAWRNSETMALIKELPSSTFIYSNEPEGVYILTGRPATMFISSPIDGVRMEYRSGYEAYLDQVRAQLMEGKAVLVIFQPEALDQALLADLGAGVPEYARVSDGVILGMP